MACPSWIGQIRSIWLRLFQKNSYPREVTVTGQKQPRQPAIDWPVTVTLDIYFLEKALVDKRRNLIQRFLANVWHPSFMGWIANHEQQKWPLIVWALQNLVEETHRARGVRK